MRSLLAWTAVAGAAAHSEAAPSPISSAPVSTPSRSARRTIRSPARCWKQRSFPSPRRAPIARGASARPRPPMSRRSLAMLPAMILDGGPCALGLEFDGARHRRRRRHPASPWRAAARGDRDGARAQACEAWAGRPCDLAGPARHSLRAADAAPPRCAAARRKARHCLPSARTRRTSPAPRSISASAAILSKPRRISSPRCERLDAAGVEAIAVMPIPAHGLGEAINDRLKRACFARDDSRQRRAPMTREGEPHAAAERRDARRARRASSARSTPSAIPQPWRPISSNGATAMSARRRWC